MGRHRVTPRVRYEHPMRHVVGCTFRTGISPTGIATLVDYDDKLAYYITEPNEKWPKYNACAGQEFWIQMSLAICMKPEELSCKIA